MINRVDPCKDEDAATRETKELFDRYALRVNPELTLVGYHEFVGNNNIVTRAFNIMVRQAYDATLDDEWGW